jgi:hypothetical protein
VKDVERIGVRLGNWLTSEQSRRLWQAPSGVIERFWPCCSRVAYNAMKRWNLLGHVSIQTTERYLACKQRIRGAVNDKIGIEPPD